MNGNFSVCVNGRNAFVGRRIAYSAIANGYFCVNFFIRAAVNKIKRIWSFYCLAFFFNHFKGKAAGFFFGYIVCAWCGNKLPGYGIFAGCKFCGIFIGKNFTSIVKGNGAFYFFTVNAVAGIEEFKCINAFAYAEAVRIVYRNGVIRRIDSKFFCNSGPGIVCAFCGYGKFCCACVYVVFIADAVIFIGACIVNAAGKFFIAVFYGNSRVNRFAGIGIASADFHSGNNIFCGDYKGFFDDAGIVAFTFDGSGSFSGFGIVAVFYGIIGVFFKNGAAVGYGYCGSDCFAVCVFIRSSDSGNSNVFNGFCGNGKGFYDSSGIVAHTGYGNDRSTCVYVICIGYGVIRTLNKSFACVFNGNSRGMCAAGINCIRKAGNGKSCNIFGIYGNLYFRRTKISSVLVSYGYGCCACFANFKGGVLGVCAFKRNYAFVRRYPAVCSLSCGVCNAYCHAKDSVAIGFYNAGRSYGNFCIRFCNDYKADEFIFCFKIFNFAVAVKVNSGGTYFYGNNFADFRACTNRKNAVFKGYSFGKSSFRKEYGLCAFHKCCKGFYVFGGILSNALLACGNGYGLLCGGDFCFFNFYCRNFIVLGFCACKNGISGKYHFVNSRIGTCKVTGRSSRIGYAFFIRFGNAFESAERNFCGGGAVINFVFCRKDNGYRSLCYFKNLFIASGIVAFECNGNFCFACVYVICIGYGVVHAFGKACNRNRRFFCGAVINVSFCGNVYGNCAFFNCFCSNFKTSVYSAFIIINTFNNNRCGACFCIIAVFNGIIDIFYKAGFANNFGADFASGIFIGRSDFFKIVVYNIFCVNGDGNGFFTKIVFAFVRNGNCCGAGFIDCELCGFFAGFHINSIAGYGPVPFAVFCFCFFGNNCADFKIRIAIGFGHVFGIKSRIVFVNDFCGKACFGCAVFVYAVAVYVNSSRSSFYGDASKLSVFADFKSGSADGNVSIASAKGICDFCICSGVGGYPAADADGIVFHGFVFAGRNGNDLFCFGNFCFVNYFYFRNTIVYCIFSGKSTFAKAASKGYFMGSNIAAFKNALAGIHVKEYFIFVCIKNAFKSAEYNFRGVGTVINFIICGKQNGDVALHNHKIFGYAAGIVANTGYNSFCGTYINIILIHYIIIFAFDKKNFAVFYGNGRFLFFAVIGCVGRIFRHICGKGFCGNINGNAGNFRKGVIICLRAHKFGFCNNNKLVFACVCGGNGAFGGHSYVNVIAGNYSNKLAAGYGNFGGAVINAVSGFDSGDGKLFLRNRNSADNSGFAVIAYGNFGNAGNKLGFNGIVSNLFGSAVVIICGYGKAGCIKVFAVNVSGFRCAGYGNAGKHCRVGINHIGAHNIVCTVTIYRKSFGNLGVGTKFINAFAFFGKFQSNFNKICGIAKISIAGVYYRIVLVIYSYGGFKSIVAAYGINGFFTGCGNFEVFEVYFGYFCFFNPGISCQHYGAMCLLRYGKAICAVYYHVGVNYIPFFRNDTDFFTIYSIGNFFACKSITIHIVSLYCCAGGGCCNGGVIIFAKSGSAGNAFNINTADGCFNIGISV